jgi:hypothetical protein
MTLKERRSPQSQIGSTLIGRSRSRTAWVKSITASDAADRCQLKSSTEAARESAIDQQHNKLHEYGGHDHIDNRSASIL